MVSPPVISLERLRELLHYDPRTGLFTRLLCTSNNHTLGERVGSLNSRGYLRMMLDYRQYYAHRLAWFYMTGVWPTHEIDHRNERPADNRFRNLREATSALNKQNHSRPQRNSSSRVRGVFREKGRWRVRIQIDGRLLSCGCFDSKAAAIRARREAQKTYHPFAA